MTKMTSDQVCEEYAQAGVKLTLRLLDADEKFVLIEGDAKALEFLGSLLLAVADNDRGCSRQLGPDAAGKTFFSQSSTKGIYIHRVPCTHRES